MLWQGFVWYLHLLHSLHLLPRKGVGSVRTDICMVFTPFTPFTPFTVVEYRCSTAPMEPGAIFRAEGSGANFELFRHCRRLTAGRSGEKSNRGENVGGKAAII